ncbi:hypothetical protein FZC78_05080 [Rossellomorea vietnamensis]|uniref:Uncharacterized protein n=1 Tax=Rossellomorea vietnamensis TaxID=218284 RepID=A0A5D4NX05_9BACI|nr:hypothetical protein [Rossellomorea vietnamensis]TYS18873.1 hypothetical protein FZC78_05080 [Rossellomorea vietnamensis]
MKKNRFHACATCEHFSAKRVSGKMLYLCTRLGFETQPQYEFNCWSPKEHIRNLMKKEEDSDGAY